MTIAMTGEISEGSRILPTTPSSLVPSPVHFTPAQPRPASAGAGQPAEERVRRARGQAEQPGEQVPQDAAGQAGEDDEQHRLAPVGEQLGVGAPSLVWRLMTALVTVSATSTERKAPTRLRMADRPTATLGLQGPGRDRRSHGVGGVVEAIREVEGKRRHDDKHRVMFAASTNRACGRHLQFTNTSGPVHPLFT